jgi:hypothetical protein
MITEGVLFLILCITLPVQASSEIKLQLQPFLSLCCLQTYFCRQQSAHLWVTKLLIWIIQRMDSLDNGMAIFLLFFP